MSHCPGCQCGEKQESHDPSRQEFIGQLDDESLAFLVATSRPIDAECSCPIQSWESRVCWASEHKHGPWIDPVAIIESWSL